MDSIISLLSRLLLSQQETFTGVTRYCKYECLLLGYRSSGTLRSDDRGKCVLVSSYQINAHFLYFIAIYMLHYNPQHVSSSILLIFRRTNCIITASGIATLCKQPYSMQVESGLQSALNRRTVLYRE